MAHDLIVSPRDLARDCKCSLAFDGVDDYVAFGNPLVGDDGWSIFTWVKFLRVPLADFDVPLAVGIPDQGGGYGGPWFGLRTSGELVAGHFATGCGPEKKMDLCRWYRVALTHPKGSGKARLYLDGKQKAIQPINTTSSATGAYGYIGRYGISGYYSKSLLHDVRVYRRECDPAEVAADARGEWIDATSLARRLRLDDGPTGTAYEEIGGTSEPVVGALPSPIVPFRRRSRLVNVPAAVRFPGTAFSFVTIPDHVDLRPGSGSWGVMFWLRQDRYLEWSSIAQKGVEVSGQAGWVIGRSSIGDLSIRVSDGVSGAIYAPGASIATNGHLHLALVCDRSSGKLLFHVNAGPPVVCSLGALGSVDVGDPLRLGGVASWSNKFVGSQSEMVWRKGSAFTWEEVRAHYFDGTVPDCPAGCKQIGWALDEGSGTTAHSSPAGYDGTLSADSWTTSTRSKARSAANARDAA